MFLLVFGLAAFFAIMILAVLLPLKPDALKAAKFLVCANDEEIEISTSVSSYHQPGERSIEIYCKGYGKKRDVKLKTLLMSFLVSFAAALPFSFLIVSLAARFFAEN